MRAIFAAQPAVANAFRALVRRAGASRRLLMGRPQVPDKLSEQEFWAKYITARVFHRDKQRGDAAARRVRGKTTCVGRAVCADRALTCALRAAMQRPEDDLLSRAIEAADKQPVGGDATTRAHVPVDVDIGANDSVLDNEHYGARSEPPPTHDARATALVAQYNRHGALVLDAHAQVGDRSRSLARR